MISAPNRPLPLNGNKLFLFLVIAILCNCSSPSKLKSNEPVIVKADVTIKKDTVIVPTAMVADSAELKLKQQVPAESEAVVKKEKLSQTYKVGIVLPFTEQAADDRYLQYYGGMKLAAQQLEEEGFHVVVKVYNAADKDVISKLSSEPLQLIFAPSDEALLKSVVELGKSKGITVVSPFFSLSSVENTPGYIQLKPSLRSHFSALLKHALDHYPLDQISLIGRNTKNDKAWFKYFQSNAAEYFPSSETNVLNEYFISDDSLATGSFVYGPLMQQGKSVFIFPNYSYKDELYLYNAMRRLLAEKGELDVIVYGMPILKDSEKMGFDFYRNLNIHLPASRYVESFREEVKNFDRKFFDSYGALPEEDAYEGFDHMLFLCRNLCLYGSEMTKYMSSDSSQYLQAKFDIRPAHTEGSPAEIDYFENKHLEILRFDGHRFVKAF